MSEQENAQTGVETVKTAEELAESLRKAEAKIVELKKTATPVKEEVIEPQEQNNWFDEEAFERKYEEKKFFESNPDMLEYKDRLLEKKALGNSWEEAKLLVENSDETIANRKVASQTNFTSWEVPSNWNMYTMEELAEIWKHNPKKYGEIMADFKQGKVVVK